LARRHWQGLVQPIALQWQISGRETWCNSRV
jgi:hypothetical protein